MLRIIPRRPYFDDMPDGYMESDLDFVFNNLDVCVAFLEGNLLKACQVALDALGCDRTRIDRLNAQRIIHAAIKEGGQDGKQDNKHC